MAASTKPSDQPAASTPSNTQLPGVDMSALAGISPEQLAIIARLFQSGALTMPPPPPTAETITTTSQAPSPSVPASTGAALPSRAAQQLQPAPQQDPDEPEMEEGELDDIGVGKQSETRDFLRPPPTGPRSTSPNIPGLYISSSPGRATVPVNRPETPSRSTAARRFVAEMVKAGYSFDSVAQEVGHRQALRRMFIDLGLPVPSNAATQDVRAEPTTTKTSGSSQPSTSRSALVDSPRNTTRPAAIAKRPAPAKTGAVNRSEYLARLQAAKNKKSETPAHFPKGSITSTKTPSQPARAFDDGLSSEPKPSPAGKDANKTALARQRLMALKAQQAAKETPAVPVSYEHVSAASPPPSRLSDNGLGAGLADLGSRAAKETELPLAAEQAVNITPFRASADTQNRPTAGLPGLFMMGSEQKFGYPFVSSENASTDETASSAKAEEGHIASGSNLSLYPAASGQSWENSLASRPRTPPSQPISRKRPVAADFDDIRSSPVFLKRPFGQSRGASEDESIIIEDSSDDEDEEETNGDTANSHLDGTRLQTKPFRHVGPLSDFPPRTNLRNQTSTLSTPGSITPGSVEYQRKMQEIEEMNRKIAKIQRKKESVKGTATKQSSSASTPVPPDSNLDTPKQQSANSPENLPDVVEAVSVDGSNQATGSATVTLLTHDETKFTTALKLKQQKEYLQERIRELQQNGLKDAIKTTATSLDGQFDSPHTGSVTVAPPANGTVESTVQIPVTQTQRISQSPSHSTSGVDIEDGEVSDDDSISKFYDQAPDQTTAVQDSMRESQDFCAGNAPPGVDIMSDGAVVTPAVDEDDAVSGSSIPGDKLSPQESFPSAMSFGTVVEVNTPAISQSPGLHQCSMEALNHTDPTTSTLSQHQESLPHAQMESTEDEMMYELPPHALSDGELEASEANYRTTKPQRHGDTSEQLAPADGVVRETAETFPTSSSTSQSEESKPSPSQDEFSFQMSSTAESAADLPASDGVVVPEIDSTEPVLADDLAPELQPSAEDQTQAAKKVDVNPRKFFTPYVSPLAKFKDFIYHADYPKVVQGGFRSLTYSNRIDTSHPVCPYEAAGGVCNDHNCAGQHFASMALDDNGILAVMASKKIPVQSPEDREQWNRGLTLLIQDLKLRNANNNAGVIVKHIAEFRRKFVGDPSKVLHLG